MSHKPIIINNLSLSFPHKICFEGFSAKIHEGDHISIIGKNGTGKSHLLKMLYDIACQYINVSYIEQVIDNSSFLSGGERFNKALSQAIASNPDMILLDEPTNHLDINNRKSLLRMLDNFEGTLIMVSHDKELIRHSNIIWHIDNSKVHIFKGYYDDYIKEITNKRSSIEHQLSVITQEKKKAHFDLMQEQKRAKNSKQRGEKSIDQRKWPTITSKAKANRSSETAGKKKQQILEKQEYLAEQLDNFRLPEIIKPKFSLSNSDIGDKVILSIQNGSIYYEEALLDNINISIRGNEKLAITGPNGSGKTSLIKTIMGHNINRSGEWLLPNIKDIGYLDQHYANLHKENTVFEEIEKLNLSWTNQQIRSHLNDFLFRKNEEVNNLIPNLSGGEKVRLSLSIIAAKAPKLLILDEITNNIDLETKEHIIQILKEYPGALIIISHEQSFLDELNIEHYHSLVENGKAR